ncbi:hypothetical protein [Sorangium sp. So ce1151]|uniref:hypothetical protein n=1 Tax=Sorangium sp. So ce1151 TaxID=3133332 RepID=UPI003F5E52B9
MLLTRLRDQSPERDEKPTPAARVEDVVLLVRGFLGFGHFGGFFCFADRACGALEVKLGRPGRLLANTTSVSRSTSGGAGGGARAPSPSAPPPADS